MPTECSVDLFGLAPVCGRAVIASYDGGAMCPIERQIVWQWFGGSIFKEAFTQMQADTRECTQMPRG